MATAPVRQLRPRDTTKENYVGLPSTATRLEPGETMVKYGLVKKE